jgi:hypothetical protein
VSTLQTVFSTVSHQEVMVVRCIAAHQRHICLSSRPHSSLAKQAVEMEVPFTFPIVVVAKVFYMVYVVMIVAQQAQVVHITSLRT